MGLDNRDYLRDESIRYGGGSGQGGGFSFGSDSPMCKRLLLITIGVYIAQAVFTRAWTQEELIAARDRQVQFQQELAEAYGEDVEKAVTAAKNTPLKPARLGMMQKASYVQEWCELDTNKVLSGQIWRLLTYGFCHDRSGPFHILFNMLFFWWFGRRLESLYGSKEFLSFYLVGLAVSGLCFVGIDLLSGNPTAAIGASGAVMAVTMLYALHYPTQVVYLFFIIPIEIRWLVVLLAIMDLHPVLKVFAGEALFADSVAHSAHLGGLLFGYLYGRNRWNLLPFWTSMTTWWQAKRRGLRVVRPSVAKPGQSQKLADEMDAILRKISEQGEASLTSSERKTLERASRELRDRKN